MRGLLYTKLTNISLASLVLVSLVLVSLLMTGCGFHPRGMSEVTFKTISIQGNSLSMSRELSGGGTVREYELVYKVSFRTRLPNSPLWSEAQTVQSRRNFSYDDKALLAKLDEENKLNADMHSEVVREIMRRLSAIKRLQP